MVPALAMALAVSGCQSTDLPSWAGGGKPQQAPTAPPQAASPPGTAATDDAATNADREFAYQNLPPDTLSAADPSGLIRVGLLVPLSGKHARIGEALLNAAQMAVFDAADERFVLQPYDTKGTQDGAQEAAALAVSHGVQLILGPVFSGSVQAVAAQARAGGVRMIAYSTNPEIAGDGVYVIGFLLREQARRLVAHARQHGMERFAALAPDTAFGRLMVRAYSQAVEEMGGTVTDTVFVGPDRADLDAKIKALTDFERRKAALAREKQALEGRQDAASQRALARLDSQDTAGPPPFDALLLPMTGTQLKESLALLAYYDVDGSQAKLMGPMLWNHPSVLRDPALVGAWFPAPPPASHDSFSERYRRTYGTAAPDIASLGYDTTALAAILARQADGMPFSDAALTTPTGFAGVDGLFRFRQDGTSERGFAIMEIRPEGPVTVGEAPRSFAPPRGSLPAY